MVQPALRVEGLAELRRALSKITPIEAKTELRVGLKAAAEVVARDAQGRIPSKTGRARASVRATSGGNRAYVVGGKARVPYYGWLDFGSRSPRSGQSRSTGPWTGTGRGPTDGRFIYPAFDAKQNEVVRLVGSAVSKALNDLNL